MLPCDRISIACRLIYFARVCQLPDSAVRRRSILGPVLGIARYTGLLIWRSNSLPDIRKWASTAGPHELRVMSGYLFTARPSR
jgi:hypothetical protein